MYKTLRIIFTVVSAVFAGLALPVGYLLDGSYALPCAIGCAIVAFIFFGLMMVCKKNQEIDERKNMQNTDFLSPEDPAERQTEDNTEQKTK